jgi:hypothetical protein
MQKWIGLLGILVALAFLIGLERQNEAYTFDSNNIDPPFFFADGAGNDSGDPAFLKGLPESGAEPHGGPGGVAFRGNKIYVVDSVNAPYSLFEFISTGPNRFPVGNYMLGDTTGSGTVNSKVCGRATDILLSRDRNSFYVTCRDPNQYDSGIMEIDAVPPNIGKFITWVVRSYETDPTPPNWPLLKPVSMAMIADGDLIVSARNLASGGCLGAVFRIEDPAGSPVIRTCIDPTTDLVDADGLTVSHDGVIYVTGQGSVDSVFEIPLTPNPTPGSSGCGGMTLFYEFTGDQDGTATGPDGVAVCHLTNDDNLFVNHTDGSLYKLPLPVAAPGSAVAVTSSAPGQHERGDLVKVSPDGFLFATQGAPYDPNNNPDDAFGPASVAKIGPACFETDGCVTLQKATFPSGGTNFQFTGQTPSGNAGSNLLDHAETVPFCEGLGTYTFSESPKAGWTLANIACSGGFFSTIRYGTSPSFPHGAFVPGDISVRIVLSFGENVTCVFTNERDQGCINIIKQVVPDSTEPIFTFDQSFEGPPPTTGPQFTRGDDGVYTYCGDTGVYHFSEQQPIASGWTLTNIVCTTTPAGSTFSFHSYYGPASVITALGFLAFVPGHDGVRINLAKDTTVTCTFTNSEDACITILKLAIQTPPAGTLFNFHWNGPPPYPANRNFTLTAGGPGHTVCGPPGLYRFDEVAPYSGYYPAIMDCAPHASSPFNGYFTTVLAAGEHVTCTFTNSTNVPIAPPVGGVVTLPVSDSDSPFSSIALAGAAAGVLAAMGAALWYGRRWWLQ